MKRSAGLFLLAVVAVSAAGCSQESPPEKNVNLRIAVPDSLGFEMNYRDYYDAAFPDWDLTLAEFPEDSISYSEKQWSDWLETQKPDLMVLNVFAYRTMADAGQLRNLEEYAGRTGMDLESFNPAVLDYLKGNKEGKLYALSPYFNTSALYYNKDLFDRLGISYPNDDMTWAQTLDLADRFMHDSRLGGDEFGLHVKWVSTPFDLMKNISYTEGIEYLNSQTGELTIDTPGWRNIFDLVIDAYRSGTFRTQSIAGEAKDGTVYYGPEDLAQTELFAKGMAAMTVDGDSLMRTLKEQDPGFRWGAVTAPVRASDPSRAGWFGTGLVFAIPVVSSLPNQAWESLAYLHSEHMGRASIAIGGDLLSLNDDPAWRQDDDYQVFYRKLPANSLPSTSESSIPASFYEPFNQLADSRIRDVLSGSETVEAALASIQQEGEGILRQARLDQKQDIAVSP